MKLVHAADLHVDSPLRGLERYEGAPIDKLRGATRRALENLVTLCIEQQASLLLLAGDLFDGGWPDYGTGLFFNAQMLRLRQAGVRVVMLRGNHDAASQITRELRPPDNVRELSTKKPESIVLEDLGIVVHGQGFATRDVQVDLADRYPSPLEGAFNIGLLHTSLNGRAGHAAYASTTLEILRDKGYEYWALGHVHAREVVAEHPPIVFPGNLQGRHARETGPKGATVLTLEDGKLLDFTHHALDAVRWELCELSVKEASSVDDVAQLAQAALAAKLADAGGRLLAMRLRLHGASRAHAALVRDQVGLLERMRESAQLAGDGSVWLERVVVHTEPARAAGELAARNDAVADLVRSLAELADGDLAELGEALADLRRKLPQALLEGDDAIRLDDPEYLRAMLPDVRELLLCRLLEEDAG